MADTETETPAEQATETAASEADQAGSEGGSALDKLEAKVDKLFDMVRGLIPGTGSGASDEERQAGIASEVKSELARLKAAEDRKASSAADKKRVAELEAQVKKITEKPPREYRKITQRLWGDGE